MTGWQDIEAAVLRRIQDRDWPPGSAIPNEADLARDFGVARATVNRALQSLAEAGWLDRRRKAGTRVALHPVRKAILSIPILRTEIADMGLRYGYRLDLRAEAIPPAAVARRMGTDHALLHLQAVHLADDRPWVHEDRWVNQRIVPEIMAVDLAVISANEWLVAHAPFSRGDYAIGAVNADATMARAIGCTPGTALLTVDRSTWAGDTGITTVTLTFAADHRIRAAF